MRKRVLLDLEIDTELFPIPADGKINGELRDLLEEAVQSISGVTPSEIKFLKIER